MNSIVIKKNIKMCCTEPRIKFTNDWTNKLQNWICPTFSSRPTQRNDPSDRASWSLPRSFYLNGTVSVRQDHYVGSPQYTDMRPPTSICRFSLVLRQSDCHNLLYNHVLVLGNIFPHSLTDPRRNLLMNQKFWLSLPVLFCRHNRLKITYRKLKGNPLYKSDQISVGDRNLS